MGISLSSSLSFLHFIALLLRFLLPLQEMRLVEWNHCVIFSESSLHIGSVPFGCHTPAYEIHINAAYVYDRTISHHSMSEAQKQSIMREVLEEHISPNELARKYSIPAYAIRDWIKKAGHTLPKSYKRFA